VLRHQQQATTMSCRESLALAYCFTVIKIQIKF